jgi:GDP-L-fucose synthase
MSDFWRQQRVLVTGGHGFLGRHVAGRLRELDCASLAVPARSDYDLRVLPDVQRLYRDLRPTLVFHLAARVGGIAANRAHPAEFFYDNLMMGSQLLDQAWRAGVGKFVAVGTVCSYPARTTIPFNEDALWDGAPEASNAPYGQAKRMLIVQSAAYRQQYGFNSITLLPANLYGPHDDFEPDTSHVIPALIRRCIDARNSGARELCVWGDGTATREFLYVDDAADGLLLAAERYDDSAPVNLGSGSETSIAELAKHIAKEVGFTGAITWDSSKPNGQPRRRLDTSRAWERFGFRAATRLADGLRRSVAWYESTTGGSRR